MRHHDPRGRADTRSITSAGATWTTPTATRWWSTGGRPWRSPSTGRRRSTRWAWPAGDASPSPGASSPTSSRRTSTTRSRCCPRRRARRARPAARGTRPGPHRPDARHRGHHPGRTGRGDPRRARRMPRGARRTWHREDRGGLHRATFLLYEQREVLARAGVLVLGPNRVFLEYISQVLPSLGETSVTQSTLDQLLGLRFRCTLVDTNERAHLLGDAHWSTVIRRAADEAIAPPVAPLELRFRSPSRPRTSRTRRRADRQRPCRVWCGRDARAPGSANASAPDCSDSPTTTGAVASYRPRRSTSSPPKCSRTSSRALPSTAAGRP